MTGKRIAIIIGVSEFEDEALPNLEASSQDAMRLAQVLQASDVGNYEVKMFLNSASYNINKTIESLFRSRHRDDVLLLFYSGHGIKDEYGRLYFATVNTDRNLLRSTAISASFVNEVMNYSRSRNQIVLLDCCYSGAFARGMEDSRGRVIITSASSVEFAFDAESEDDSSSATGVFTNTLIRGLETGYADLNSDGEISVIELYSYVYNQLQNKSARQTPRLWAFDVNGDIIIAKNRRQS